jgi:hypothetical protein
MEVVALLRRVFLCLVAKAGDRFSEQRINIKFYAKLSLEKKHGAFNMFPVTKPKV